MGIKESERLLADAAARAVALAGAGGPRGKNRQRLGFQSNRTDTTRTETPSSVLVPELTTHHELGSDPTRQPVYQTSSCSADDTRNPLACSTERGEH